MKSIMTHAAVVFLTAVCSAQITIPTVSIDNPGNAPDPLTGHQYGSVAYAYDIGRTEVTNAQYAAFLNAVAATDLNGLYDSDMAGFFGGILRSGSPGSYTYTTVNGRANNPVNWVTFWSCARFANWLHNGQPTGAQDNTTTEGGAYTLTPGAIAANSVTRNAGWRWAICSKDEWYKAAYHQPAAQGGDSDDYWYYPTSSNTVSVSQANYGYSVNNNTSPVGSYSANFYGTFDMGGNVWEWIESVFSTSLRDRRGGAFNSDYSDLSASKVSFDQAWAQYPDVGFRVSKAAGLGWKRKLGATFPAGGFGQHP